MKRVFAVLLLLTLSLALPACVNMQAVVADLPQEEVRGGCDHVLYIAHRGLTQEATADGVVVHGENTAESFGVAADTATVWGIETDVWQTKDGQLVCMHDKDAVQGVPDVHEAMAEDVLRGGLKKAPAYHAPTFQTYLDICKRGGKAAVVEIKDAAMTTDCMNAVLAAIKQSGVKSVIISFYMDKLMYVRGVDADIPCMLLFHGKWQQYYAQVYGTTTTRDDLLDLTIQNNIGLSAEYKYLYNNRGALGPWVEKYHQNGLDVGVWTVDDVYAAIYHATEMCVDYITTNVDMGSLVAATIANPIEKPLCY